MFFATVKLQREAMSLKSVHFNEHHCLNFQGFLRCFWDPSRVPRIENRLLRIRELSSETSERILQSILL